MSTALFITLASLLLALLGLAGSAVLLYNALVRGRILVREAFSGIDVQLKRRHDLIPNLVTTVQAYAHHERAVLEQVTRLRTQAMSDLTLAEKQQDERRLAGALKHLLAVAENYPALQANSTFLDLQQQLAAIEDDVQKARRYYNGTVREYNTQVESFPSNLVAGIFGFDRADFFELERVEEAAIPPVELQPDAKS